MPGGRAKKAEERLIKAGDEFDDMWRLLLEHRFWVTTSCRMKVRAIANAKHVAAKQKRPPSLRCQDSAVRMNPGSHSKNRFVRTTEVAPTKLLGSFCIYWLKPHKAASLPCNSIACPAAWRQLWYVDSNTAIASSTTDNSSSQS
jgi:hypothetical protein